MATIRDIPDEILLYIFNYLESHNLRHCQKVCRSWYSAAHCLFLKEITLLNIGQFIRSIDANPTQSYLKAVKTITIYPQPKRKYKFSKQAIRKLFCRFPNLESVEIQDNSIIYDNFNDRVCGIILHSCPKLIHFTILLFRKKTEDQYLDILYKLRLLLTQINLDYITFTPRLRDPIQYIKSFPRLRALRLVPGHLNNFQSLLPVLMELSNVELINFQGMAGDTDDNFAEEYMAALTKDKQELLLKRLSNITGLLLQHGRFSASSNKFICKYFNKLYHFEQSSRFQQNLTDEEKDSVCQDIINMTCSVNQFAKVSLSSIKVPDLIKILPTFVSEKFYGQHINKGLGLVVADQPFSDISLRSTKSLSLRHVKVTFPDRLTLKEIVAIMLITMAPIDIANKLVIDLSKYKGTVVTHFYYNMFDLMESLKSVAVHVPASCVIARQEQTRIYPLVEELIVGSEANVYQCQALLYEFFTRFPNLNTLYIFYFCGNFCKEQRHVQLDLKDCTLEKLTLDISPLRNIWDKHWRKTNFVKEQFIVIQVDEQLYKVSLESNTTCTRITESNLKGFARGKDYIQLKIIVGSLKRLDIYYDSGRGFCKNPSGFISRGYYVGVHNSFTTVFNHVNY